MVPEKKLSTTALTGRNGILQRYFYFAMSLLFATLCSYELTAKRTRMLLKARSRTLGFQ